MCAATHTLAREPPPWGTHPRTVPTRGSSEGKRRLLPLRRHHNEELPGRRLRSLWGLLLLVVGGLVSSGLPPCPLTCRFAVCEINHDRSWGLEVPDSLFTKNVLLHIMCSPAKQLSSPVLVKGEFVFTYVLQKILCSQKSVEKKVAVTADEKSFSLSSDMSSSVPCPRITECLPPPTNIEWIVL